VNDNIAAFLKVLDSDDNTTGGGTASAVAGAMAGALVAMVARLSIGKDGMEPDGFYEKFVTEAQTISGELFDGGHADSQAFLAVLASFKLPKQTDEEKATRRKVIQDAWVNAARVPLTNAERCARVLKMGLQLRGRSYPDAASDLECGMLLARAGLLGCLENVQINLPSIKDPDVAASLTDSVYALREFAAANDTSLLPS
jgi:formiminotetrahydrofolate cyclodeaminase